MAMPSCSGTMQERRPRLRRDLVAEEDVLQLWVLRYLRLKCYATSSEDSASSTGLGRRWTLPEFRRNYKRKFYQARLRRSTNSVHQPGEISVCSRMLLVRVFGLLKDSVIIVNTRNPPVLSRNEMRSAVRIRSSALFVVLGTRTR